MKKLLILLFLISCGSPELKDSASVDPELRIYFSRFSQDIQVSVDGISGEFGDLKPNIAGVCRVYSSGVKQVIISKQHWDRFSDLQREQLVYHELGHCVLDIRHNNELLEDGCPKSIMYPNTFEKCYDTHYSYYIEELKGF